MIVKRSMNQNLGRGRCALVSIAAVTLLLVGPASAWVDLNDHAQNPRNPRGAVITDGSYVMNVGELQINITNWGLIGSHYSSGQTYSVAPSGQWPAGSGNEYLWGAGLWVGGILLGERLVSTGQYATEIRARDGVEDTIYEALSGELVRPAGNSDASGARYPEPDPNDDGDVDDQGFERIDEETLNGYDDDLDGLVDEDFGQIGNQMMVTTMYDNTRLAAELFADHTPLNIRVVQESFAWEADEVDDFVGFQYTITNVGVSDISNVYIGFFADPDIGPRSGSSTARDDMAGSYAGAVRATDGSFVPVEVGFMYDAAEEGRLDGYFGIAFLSHATDPSGQTAPRSVGLRTFQHFSGQAPFDQGGDPTNDGERYTLLSSPDRDSDVREGKQDDFRFLVSAGPFETLEPDADLTFQVAIVVGSGQDGMLRACAEAAITWYGNYFNRISDEMIKISDPTGEPLATGVNGRETLLCRDDFDPPGIFDGLYPDYGDETCVSEGWLLQNGTVVGPDDLFQYEDPSEPGRNKTCAMFNMDNCFECFRQKDHVASETSEESLCDEFDMENYWNCPENVAADLKAGCTGLEGNETQVNWLVGMAPPPPGMRLWPTDNRVHVYWDDESENTPDVRLRVIDFESYRVWRADNWDRPYGASLENGPGSNLWQLIAEYDVVDSFQVDYGEGVDPRFRMLPLGRNTGLDVVKYRPQVLDDPDFNGLAEAMQLVVDADPLGIYSRRPPMLDIEGEVLEISRPIQNWAGYPDVLDTFWAVTARPESLFIDPDTLDPVVVVFGKRATQYYEYIDPDVHNGFVYFYAVTATDRDLEFDDGAYLNVGAGQSGDPSSNFGNASPGTDAQTAEERARNGANIFVYPNPATRDALNEFQELFPNGDDPTGVKVKFTNLPAARNTIEIFTLSGDLVQTIEHDGTSGFGEVGWNLISRNGQEIVSGIYMYVVRSDDGGFDDFIGKFVVVR